MVQLPAELLQNQKRDCHQITHLTQCRRRRTRSVLWCHFNNLRDVSPRGKLRQTLTHAAPRSLPWSAVTTSFSKISVYYSRNSSCFPAPSTYVTHSNWPSWRLVSGNLGRATFALFSDPPSLPRLSPRMCLFRGLSKTHVAGVSNSSSSFGVLLIFYYFHFNYLNTAFCNVFPFHCSWKLSKRKTTFLTQVDTCLLVSLLIFTVNLITVF